MFPYRIPFYFITILPQHTPSHIKVSTHTNIFNNSRKNFSREEKKHQTKLKKYHLPQVYIQVSKKKPLG